MSGFFRAPDRCQCYLLPVDMMDWPPAGDIVHLVVDAAELMGVSAFEAEHRVGCAGQAPPFDPKVLLALLIYACALGTILGPIYGARKSAGMRIKISLHPL